MADSVRPQGCAVTCTPPPLGLTAPVSYAVNAVERGCNRLTAPCLCHCITQVDDFELLHDQPLASVFPKRTQDGMGLCGGFSFARGRHGPAGEAIVAASCPSTSAILMFFRADFPSEPAVCPDFRLERPSMRRHHTLAEVPMLEPPRTFLRFSRKRSAASGLPD